MPETMTNTRKIAHIAILSTLSFLLMYLQFPLIPSASFLQFDFSVLPVLVGLVMFDLKSALGILILRTLLKLLLNNGGISTIIGLPMNVLALGVFVVALTKLEKLHTGISRGNAWLNCGNVYAELCLRCATLCQICEF